MRGQTAGSDPPYQMRWWPAPGATRPLCRSPRASRPTPCRGLAGEQAGTRPQERLELIDGETVPGGELLLPSKEIRGEHHIVWQCLWNPACPPSLPTPVVGRAERNPGVLHTPSFLNGWSLVLGSRACFKKVMKVTIISIDAGGRNGGIYINQDSTGDHRRDTHQERCRVDRYLRLLRSVDPLARRATSTFWSGHPTQKPLSACSDRGRACPGSPHEGRPRHRECRESLPCRCNLP